MCGIIGGVSKDDIVERLIKGLELLEYRGYDSAGVAVMNKDLEIRRVRTTNRVSHLLVKTLESGVRGTTGIAHTRWATHGKSEIRNAHPHMHGEKVAIVHNGILENHVGLRNELIKQGVKFNSETDSEVIAHLIDREIRAENNSFLKGVKGAVKRLKGAYAIGVVVKGEDRIIATKVGSPLVIGLTKNGNYISSSIDGLSGITNKFIILDDGEIADIRVGTVTVCSPTGEVLVKSIYTTEGKVEKVSKGDSAHYMMKEMLEQPDVIENTILSGSVPNTDKVFGNKAKKCFKEIERVKIIACGTSRNAGLLGSYWLESVARVECSVEIASEFVYRNPVLDEKTLYVFVSQSGETADVLVALREVNSSDKNLCTLSICNNKESTLSRDTKLGFITKAGLEIGVASTKSFTTQLVALGILVVHINKHTHNYEEHILRSFSHLSEGMRKILDLYDEIDEISEKLVYYKSMLFIGRGVMYPIAEEGALKMKELTYIHAEGYAGGELKHGPLALIDDQMPVIALAIGDSDSKISSNIEEIRSRDGVVYVLDGCGQDEFNAPILMSVYMQLLSYQVALRLGRDIDKPRNLAKSVTVE